MGPFFTSIATQSVERDVLAAIIGMCVGSFLNVLALRTLAEKPFWSTIFGSSECSHCGHKLAPSDLIPVLSYALLRGKCRYCQQTISWQYPVVEIATAVTFVVVLHHFQLTNSYGVDDVVKAVGLDFFMLLFCCILIAVCVTDFKEKLIPHEITYPSIIIGIAFSAWGRDDLMPTLAGIGISYILFDFLAFYGLKIYYLSHKDEEDAKNLDRAVRAKDKDLFASVPIAREAAAAEVLANEPHTNGPAESARTPETDSPKHVAAFELFEEAVVRSERLSELEDTEADSEGIVSDGLDPDATDEAKPEAKFKTQAPLQASDEINHLLIPDDYDPEIDEAFGLPPATKSTEVEEEEFEVMGGGDAVLAALIAAWIGLENLGITLVFGFMFGSLMGSCYLAHELHKRGLLKKAIQTTAIITIALLAVAEGTVYLFASNTGMLTPGHEFELQQLPWGPIALGSTLGGILFGTILNGKDGSKPFPFGPALAAGAMVAIFTDPFHKINLSQAAIQFGSFLLDLGHN